VAAKFGTSGLRGLVSDLTPAVVAAHVRAFLRSCPTGGGLCIGRDLRESSPALSAVVAAAARDEGLDVTDCGAVPTPALAAWAMARGQAAIMVTGSHIPADRNGLKFYTPAGEITAAEQALIEALAPGLGDLPVPAADPSRNAHAACAASFRDRYVAAFGADALAGLRIGLYERSTAARDLLAATLAALGADVVPLGRTASFIAVDTEAIDPETRLRLAGWSTEHRLDAIVSADGDADRPMVADEKGRIVLGDVLGAIVANSLGASHVVTPVSSNTMVEAMGVFDRVLRTRIGSPHVIAAMDSAQAPGARVVGYEANGGFLLGFDAATPAGTLPALATRDSFLPIIAPLAAARRAGTGLGALVAALPARFTAADRAQDIPTEASARLVARLSASAADRAAFFGELGPERSTDLTDGLRLTFSNGDIVHLRPSGNAPELRCYAESDSAGHSADLVARYLDRAARACRET